MSRGPGRVQKIITDLIASNPHGAWSVTDTRHRRDLRGRIALHRECLEFVRKRQVISSVPVRQAKGLAGSCAPWLGSTARR